MTQATRIELELCHGSSWPFLQSAVTRTACSSTGNLKFDSKTDNPEKFLVTLQIKAIKAYQDPNPQVVAPINAHAADAAAEQTQCDQGTARRAEIISSVQEARSVQISRQFIGNMPGLLRAKLLEEAEITEVDSCFLHANSHPFIIFVKQMIQYWTRLVKWVHR